MLNRAADPEREIKLWRHGLPGAADLPLHREPAFIADRPRRSDLSTERFCERLRLRDIFRCFDAAADGHDQWSLRQIDGRLRFLEKLQRFGANLLSAQRYGHGIDRRFARGMSREQIRAERAGLKRCKPRCWPRKRDIRRRFALEHLPDEHQLAAFVAVADAVADHSLAE